MKKIGSVLDTFSADVNSSGLPRPKVSSLELKEGFGIINDKFAGKDLNKTVMLVGIDSYNLAKNNNINMEFGSLGENILLDFNPHLYSVGTIFKIGDAQVQIMENCTICNHLSVFDKKLPKLLKECRGLYCKIVSSGKISQNSEVYLIEGNK